MEKHRILIVEDDAAVAEHVHLRLESLGFACAGITGRGDEALAMVEEHKPDLVLMDIVLQGPIDGIAAAETIRQRYDIPVIYLTAFTTPDFLARAKITEPLGYIVKPCETRELLAVLSMALYKKETDARLKEQARLTAALLSLSEGVLAYDPEGRIFQANEAAGRLFGLPPQQLVARDILDVLRLNDTAFHKPMSQQLLYRLETEGELIDQHDLELSRADGSVVPVRLNASRIRDGGERIVGNIVLLRDDSLRKRMETRLRQAAAVYASTMEGVLITDAAQRIVTVNAAFTRISGYTLEDVVGKKPAVLKSGRQDAAFYAAMWQSIAATGGWEGEMWNRRKNGEIHPQWIAIRAVLDSHGQTTHYVAVYADITQIRQSEERLAFVTQHDALTGLPNRMLFVAHLEHVIQHDLREGGRSAVLLFDLDRFKHINDTLGHPAGDDLLNAVAERLKQILRGEDVVARLGGDEFGVILENEGDAREVGAIAQKVQSALALPFQVAGHELSVTTSIGVALCPRDGEDVCTVMRNAEMAMYRAKQQGKNAYQFFDPAMTATSAERFTLENQLRQALEHEEFEVHYQPLICLQSERITSVEALVRWRHPTEGLISPARFIPVAEETGLIEPLGLWVLREACRRIKTWRDAGLPRLAVAVNVSARQFRPGLVDKVAEVLRETGVPSECLVLEITESVIMETAEDSVRILDALKALGLTLAIDDFGTGYSSLSYLKRFPVDKLKIDRSFIADIPRDAQDIAIAKAVIALAQSFALKVTAEGVETVEQWEFLKHCGCHESQGYYISRPLPAHEFATFLQNRAG